MLHYSAGSEAQLPASRPAFYSGAPSLALGVDPFIFQSLGNLISEMGLILPAQLVIRRSTMSQDYTLRSPRTEPMDH